MIHRVHTNQNPAQRVLTRSDATASASSSFTSALNNVIRNATTSGQPIGNPVTPAAPQVVVSPFNPLGLPVSAAPAPTAAEVAANPEKYKGTSFDPANAVTPNWVLMRNMESTIPSSPTPWTQQQYANYNQQLMQPPAGSTPTNNPNVFTLASGATWNRPGTVQNNATSQDYDAWRISTFGMLGA